MRWCPSEHFGDMERILFTLEDKPFHTFSAHVSRDTKVDTTKHYDIHVRILSELSNNGYGHNREQIFANLRDHVISCKLCWANYSGYIARQDSDRDYQADNPDPLRLRERIKK